MKIYWDGTQLVIDNEAGLVLEHSPALGILYWNTNESLERIVSLKTAAGMVFDLIVFASIKDGNDDLYVDEAAFKAELTNFFVSALDLGGFVEVIPTGDDAGLIIKGELQVGTPDVPKECSLGEGDSYPIPLAIHYDGISTYIDVTEILESDTSSTTGFFGGITAGTTLMAMSPNSFGSAKIKMASIGDVNPENIISEYLDSIDVWRAVNFMSTDDAFIYTQKGWNILNCASCSEQIFFDTTPILQYPWAERTLNINGTDHTGYWARFRIMIDIVSDAIVEQIKLGTNRLEISEDGQIKKYGRQRIATYYPIPMVRSVADGFAPSSTDIDWGIGITESGEFNTFRDNAEDGFLMSGVIPEGFDTSIPFLLSVWYYVTNFGGDVEQLVDLLQIKLGDPTDGSLVPITLSNIITINSGDENKWVEVIFRLEVNKLLAGDRFIVKLYRNATPGNTNDTLIGSAVLAEPSVFGIRWKI